jgi:hypothetical protein
MKTALLIPFRNINTGKDGFVWQTPSEKDLSIEFNAKNEALQNRPDSNSFVCRDDGWNII